ncbi:alpha-rhamnosidase [Vallitalea longa]|uniref:alpha-L-rhamnosidase n=1 Tax=Vallitalea longa TaxID=2936439 RepID=A0A9W6DHH6_9FIRM|nr:family 78 glycoside hydrolase catalytic domain [Vallitalea longa]GKX31473.1 alpha-rhamnosidase [Vallitalea longa]
MKNNLFVINELRCENLQEFIGIDCIKPRLSWKIQSQLHEVKQKDYKIMVSSTKKKLIEEDYDLWDSGKITDDRSVNVEYKGETLNSRETCYWKVKVWISDYVYKESEIAYWEMGLLNKEDWQGQWIGMGKRYKQSWSPLFRKEFFVSKEVKKARIYLTGLGYYEASMNGTKIGDHVLEPAQTDYDVRVFYTTYDIASYLKKGNNAIGIMLGDGWYNQTRMWKHKVMYGNPRLLCQIEIEYEDGAKEVIFSNTSWKCSLGPIVLNHVYNGETYDSRMVQSGWNFPGFNDEEWFMTQIESKPGGALASQMMPPIKTMEFIDPVNISEPQNHVFVFDFGHNLAGWTKLTVEGVAGAEITIRYAESLSENGMINTNSCSLKNLFIPQTHRYIIKGEGKEIYEARFNYSGFRYAEVTGLTCKPDISVLKAIAVYTDLEESGEFESSNGDINKIHQMARHTITSNLQGNITDCPIREKCGWLGDAMIVSDSIMYNWNSVHFWEKFVKDIESSRKVNGQWTMVVPGKRTCGEAAPAWGTAQVTIPLLLYIFYEDKWILKDQYQAIKDWTDHLRSRCEAYLISFGIGDWWYPGGRENLDVPHDLISTAYFFQSATQTAEIAKILGFEEDYQKYTILSHKIKKAFNKRYFNKGKNSYGSQTADSFALKIKLVEESYVQKVVKALVKSIRDEGFHLTTGHIGTKYVFEVLTDFGYKEEAYKTLVQSGYPGFVYLINKGYTTLPERWEGDQDYGVPRNTGSLNHPFKCGFDAWLFSHLAGIRPLKPGFKEIMIKPTPMGDIKWIKGSFDSIYGKIRSHWRMDKGIFEIDATIPANTTAKIVLPFDSDVAIMCGENISCVKKETYTKNGGYIDVGSGVYSFKQKL